MIWTAGNIPSQDGRTAVVTGSNTGIGYHTALELAKAGGHVVLACRDSGKAGDAVDRIRAEGPAGAVEAMELDLASLGSVRSFAEAFRGRHDRLDLLVNNAGIMMTPYGETEDGFEQQLGVNHLGHFALTGLLLSSLRGSDGVEGASPARVINVSSNAHRFGSMDYDNLMYAGGGYSPARAYGRSKLANLLFTLELQRRFDDHDTPILAMAAHPGFATTELARYLMEKWYNRVGMKLFALVAQSAAMGALPTLRAAADPTVEGGDYYGPDGFMEQRGHPVKVDRSVSARDPEDARWLWERSEALTGVAYDI